MSRKLNERRLKPEKSFPSYADLHHEITKSEEENTCKSYVNLQKQETYKRASEDDELVKHMSNLPGYLERGAKIREKVLNVGVLDWGRLEQWQYGHKHVPHRSSHSSTSTSNTSSSVSTDGLSGNSSRGLSCSPSRQRISNPSLQSYFMASRMQDDSAVVKSSGGGAGNCQNLGGSCGNFDAQRKYGRPDDRLSQSSILKGCNSKYLSPHVNKESDFFLNDRMCEAASCSKQEKKNQDGGVEKGVPNLRESRIDTSDQGVLRSSKPIVLLLPGDIPENSHSGAPDVQTSLVQRSESPGGTIFSRRPKETSSSYLKRDILHSRPLPDKVSRSQSQPKRPVSSSVDPESMKVPASTVPISQPVKMGIISPCRSRKAEERKHTTAASSSTNGPSQGVDQKVVTQKPRSSSPFRRFSISIGFGSRGTGCKDISHVPHQSSIAAFKSCSENVKCHAISNNSGNDKPGDSGKSRSSPLRRLLDPLLKPKAPNSHHNMESSHQDSVLANKNCRSANGKISTQVPEKELDRNQRVSCATIDANDSSKDKKCGPSSCEAILRIAVKNGQPLFTFAVDNNGNILAATVKNLTVSTKDECNYIYTFFTFREVKKKNGSWMNQAGKCKGPDYMHHVVAQMKVSDSHSHDSTGQNCVYPTAKEFVLFSVKLRNGDSLVPDYQPNDELAAIVVKSPQAINLMNYAHQSSCHNDQDLLNVAVVLPSGVHSLPSNGGPSSLIERWKTGGSCDCGGWDLACKLKILVNENQVGRKSTSSKANFTDQFELFLQGNDQDQENRPAFSFSAFKPGMYSVAFDSSLSLLQAFSICIALVDGKMPFELSKS